MSLLRSQFVRLEAVQIQRPASLDGQGRPAYGPVLNATARVVLGEQEAINPAGSEDRFDLTAWFPLQNNLPRKGDRLTYEGKRYRVADIYEGKRFSGDVQHVRAICREE